VTRLWQHWTPIERAKMYALIKDGLTDKQIGEKLYRSPRSVEFKRLSRGVVRKLGRPVVCRPDGWPVLSDPDKAFSKQFQQVL